ncbi:ankyrin repeat and SOCS box protein 8-like isoform X2 [Pomacea canaliculata]|uniref:ankyrin repeat and SOCS box protein 8-like isoform X2 n=1 Tax=Pomacea canaliculata TaxID=400727 RepID=UPI000D728E19|nr:ankyrin repeat and SOCS box protein 8-like isoform X2 [Pomacea canaliculata]
MAPCYHCTVRAWSVTATAFSFYCKKVNDIDGYGRTALHYAAERDICCTEVLLQHGADVNAGDGNHDTPLHWAAYKNHVECVKLLLQRGALVDAYDYNLDTPLSWAARRGNLEVIKILLDYNADPTLHNAKGHTPLMRAAATVASGLETAADDDCLELLVRASGQFDVRSPSGQLPPELARDNKVRETLLPLCCNPLRLQALCRTQIRRCLGHCYMPNVMRKLPMPPQLQDFLLLTS